MVGKCITVQESKGLFCLKAMAILSVIAAHTVSVSSDVPINRFLTSLWVMYGHVNIPALRSRVSGV